MGKGSKLSKVKLQCSSKANPNETKLVSSYRGGGGGGGGGGGVREINFI